MKLVLAEANFEHLELFLSSRSTRVSSVLTRIEVTRAVLRRDLPGAFETELSAALALLDLLAINDSIVASASRLDPPLLRSLDAIHLASALTLGEELEGIVTYDNRLAEAARQLGIRVFSPTGDN